MHRHSRLKTQPSRQLALVRRLLSWFDAKARDLPWRRTSDPYAIWVSEIMLQQTQVKTVIPYWERWMSELPTVQTLAKARADKLLKLWEGLGYYTRVRNMQKAAQQIMRQHRGRFPDDFADVLVLPGIGRYTAGAICSIAFNQPKPILDGNVIRVLTRVFGIASDLRERKTHAQLWELAEALVYHASRFGHHSHRKDSRTRRRTKDESNQACSHLNQSLMELGALVCTPRSPNCAVCPVRKLCVAFHEGQQHLLPKAGKRAKSTARRFIAFIVERHGRFLVRQRPEGVVNARLWEFPNCEARLPSHDGRNGVQFKLPGDAPICTIKHSITRYRMTLEAWRAAPVPHWKIEGRWLTLAQLGKLAFTSAHRKILAHLVEKTR